MYKRVFLLLLTLPLLAADPSTTRLDRIGHKLVCQCGCSQILMECNHVGCPVSPVMISELRIQLASVSPATAAATVATPTESDVLAFFIDKYGPVVLASPIRGGFDNVAWITPFAVLILGGAGVFWLLRLWRKRFAALQPTLNQIPDSESADLRARIRRDTTDPN